MIIFLNLQFKYFILETRLLFFISASKNLHIMQSICYSLCVKLSNAFQVFILYKDVVIFEDDHVLEF